MTYVIVRNSHYSPILLLETPGFSELLWTPTPGPPLRLCPGDLTAPPDPQLARAMTFAEGYKCSSCHSKKVTHGLVKGNLVDGYKGLPLCSKCAKKVDNASPHHWDSESIVDHIDITNHSNNFTWKKVLLS